MTKRNVPVYNGTLRNHSIRLPHCICECSGIRIFGMRIKSIAFTTDVAIIKNINADAIIAVYPRSTFNDRLHWRNLYDIFGYIRFEK